MGGLVQSWQVLLGPPPPLVQKALALFVQHSVTPGVHAVPRGTPVQAGVGGGGGEVLATHEPLVQTPAQHSLLVVQDSVSGWQAQVVTPLTTAVWPWQQRLHDSVRALPRLLCPRGFLLGQGLPVGMQASARMCERRVLLTALCLARALPAPNVMRAATAAPTLERRDADWPMNFVRRSNARPSIPRQTP